MPITSTRVRKNPLLFCAILFLYFFSHARPDLTIVGSVKFADSIPRIAIGLIECLKEDLNINFISTVSNELNSFYGVTEQVQAIISNLDKTPGNIALMVDIPAFRNKCLCDALPESNIKIAYSMIEGSQVPQQWVTLFNTRFDAIVVPDDCLVNIYKNSGVTKPIFVIPCGMYLDDFLDKPLKEKKNNIFVFGTSGMFVQRKNHELLVRAFAQEFGNNKQVKLIIHGRTGSASKSLVDTIKKLKLTNIEIIYKRLGQQQYIQLLTSFDCYVHISMGEGFSLVPREAMALGIPCIVTNNFAQRTICSTGLVRSVETPIAIPAYYEQAYGPGPVGYHLSCTLEDTAQALRDVYENYQNYLAHSNEAHQWVKKYKYNNLKAYYLSLIKPQKVVLGEKNIVEPDCIITSSQELYNKYKKLFTNLHSVY